MLGLFAAFIDRLMSEAAHVIGAANVALIVPVADDTESLSSLLAQIGEWDSRPREIVVAAADRDRALEALCRREGCRLLLTRANRGAQLDHGARAANAAVMWFVHADAALPHNGLDAIAAALAAGADSGCFRFTFQGHPKWYKTLLATLVALRIRCGGMVYGDQGLFVRREAYEAAGGFPHQPLFEEVRLVKALRRRGQFRVLPAPIGISTRRWERDGWCRRSLRNRCLALCYMLGVPAERLSRAYHGTMGASRETEP